MGTDAVIFVIKSIQTPNSFDFIMNRNPIHLMIYDINCKETNLVWSTIPVMTQPPNFPYRFSD
jgi:hypothetical protein